MEKQAQLGPHGSNSNNNKSKFNFGASAASGNKKVMETSTTTDSSQSSSSKNNSPVDATDRSDPSLSVHLTHGREQRLVVIQGSKWVTNF